VRSFLSRRAVTRGRQPALSHGRIRGLGH
jgi:hypothetical protein